MSARVAVLLLAVLLSACSDDTTPPGKKDGTPPASDQFGYCSLSCSGCCTSTGTCETGDNVAACGANGTQCVPCSAGQSCTNHVCSQAKDSGADKAPGSCAATCSGCCAGETCVATVSDSQCGQKGGACVDCTASSKTCQSGVCETKCTFEGGCGDNTKWCDVGKCVACDTGKLNCDNKGQCECAGTCSGATCNGTTSCDYYDLNVCGGDNTKWCWNNACTTCSPGFFNCNGTKGCECDSAGCNGTTCAGKCSGGEC